jgi:hypothetical protein
MGVKSLTVLILLLATVCSISIPVNSQDDKCMIVYSSNVDEYLKIDIKF